MNRLRYFRITDHRGVARRRATSRLPRHQRREFQAHRRRIENALVRRYPLLFIGGFAAFVGPVIVFAILAYWGYSFESLEVWLYRAFFLFYPLCVGFFLALGDRLRLGIGVCPVCAYELTDLRPAEDGCVVCPECGGAWRAPRAAGEDRP